MSLQAHMWHTRVCVSDVGADDNHEYKPRPQRLKGTQSWTATDSCSPVCWDWRLWLCIFRCSRPHENFPWLTARESQALPTPTVPASVPAQGATRTAILPLPHDDLHGTLLRKSRSFYFKQNVIITCLCFVIHELQNIYLRGPTAASGTLSDARVKKEEAWEECINDLLLWLILQDSGPGTVTETRWDLADLVIFWENWDRIQMLQARDSV